MMSRQKMNPAVIFLLLASGRGLIAANIARLKESWQDLLRDLKRRGLERSPKLITGDGTLEAYEAFLEDYQAKYSKA